MVIFYDHQIFTWQKIGGISRYFTELLCRIPEENRIQSVLASNNIYLCTKKPFQFFQFFPNKYIWGRDVIYNYLNTQRTIKLLKDGHFDIFHPTEYDTYFLPYLGRKKLIITVHDLIHELYIDNNYSRKYVSLKTSCIKRADGIIAISEQTKQNIIDYYKVPSSKIKVIYHGFERNNLEMDTSRLFDFDYILYVGDRNGYKNFEIVLQAFKELNTNNIGVKLVCTGKKFTQSEILQMKQLGIQDSIFHIFASEVQMKQLYRDAKCFVFPSIAEGFGLPLLEAFDNNCPVIASNIDCFKEIIGENGLYFDPNDKNDLLAKLNQVLSDEQTKDCLIENGINRLCLFSWKKTVDETFDYYKIIENG